MLMRILVELGPWVWWVAGLVLLGAEVLVPGVFLVWIGLAALVVGALSLLLWDNAIWPWEVQLALFAMLSVLLAWIGRRITMGRTASDEPFLNQRTASLIGRTAVLGEPIAEGRGRIQLDDTIWQVEGPDLPAGARVRIVAAHGRDLRVESA